MILRAKKRLRVHLKSKKIYGMVMFIYMNAVNYSALQLSNAREQHRRQKSVRAERLWICTNLRKKKKPETETGKNILIVVMKNPKIVQRIRNRLLLISITLRALLSIVLVQL